jgi:hypothetical protein
MGVPSSVRFGSEAAGPHLRPSRSAFAPKGDIPGDEIIDVGVTANGQKQPVVGHDLNGSFRPARLTPPISRPRGVHWNPNKLQSSLRN